MTHIEPTAWDLLEEAKWEMEGTRRAAEHYRQAAEAADPSTLPSGQRLLKEIVPGLIEEIIAMQLQAADAIASARGRAPVWAWPIQLLGAKELALITLTQSINGAIRGKDGVYSTITALALGNASAVRDELDYRRWVSEQIEANKAAKEEADWDHRDVLQAFKARYPNANRKVWGKWRRKVEATREAWSKETSLQFGAALLQALVRAAPTRFEIAMRREASHTTAYLKLSAATEEMMLDMEARVAVSMPVFRPMLIPPIPWRYEGGPPDALSQSEETPIHGSGYRLSGGYTQHKIDGVRTGWNAHTTALDRPISAPDLAAWNTLQSTPWAVNAFILDTMLEAWAEGIWIAGLEVGEVGKLPPRLDDETWAGMSQEDRSARTKRLREIHQANASIRGRSHAILDCMQMADEMRHKPAFWYPHTKDFRGRNYSAATRGPHPQGNDISKALIHFAEGKPLGPDGLYWLCVRAANTFGQDKLPLEDRVQWTLGHRLEIEACVSSPLTTTSWWTEAAEPWSFLATCHEIAMALSLSSPDDFVSHLPIPMDGSCNGLQHLAAMGLDPVGAVATNLASAHPRQDVYEEVAKRVRLQVEQDIFDGIDAARVWHGKVTRQVTKRAVMTTPYGVTDRGIREQLINDDHVPSDDQIGKGAAADYLRDRIVQALGDTVASARAIMAWLQVTADRLARAGLPFDWTTPTGTKVRQGYFTSTADRIKTLCGELNLRREDVKAGLNVRKQALGSAPNFIHSFDAAHLSMTVNAAAGEGIDAFAMIHDSYGTHACNTTRLGTLLREQFVNIYQMDNLWLLKAEIAGYAPHVQIDDPPARGDFQLEQVLDAPYFFS